MPKEIGWAVAISPRCLNYNSSLARGRRHEKGGLLSHAVHFSGIRFSYEASVSRTTSLCSFGVDRRLAVGIPT